MSETSQYAKPFLTSDAKVAGAALCEGVNVETGQAYRGTLLRFNRGGARLEFVIGGLPSSWYEDYLGRRLRVDPYEAATHQESILRAITAYKGSRQ